MKISEVSQICNIPISTLRYYDEIGLFPNLERNKNGQRNFQKDELELLKVIDCLKVSGLSIKEIKEFIDLVKQGDTTISKRKLLFEERLNKVNEEIDKLEKIKEILEYKQWYYSKAQELGTEQGIENINIPEKFIEIKKSLEC